MNINIIEVLIMTVVQFLVGSVWYFALFGQLWGQIHGVDKLPKETLDKMSKEMGPFYVVQLAVTLLTSVALSYLFNLQTGISSYWLVFVIWLGFVVPAQVSSVLFGGTEPRWMLKKILVQSFGSLACLLIATVVSNLL